MIAPTKVLVAASQRVSRKWLTLITDVRRFSSWLLQISLLTLALDGGHLPPLKHHQGIVVCVEVHICGCVERGEDPGLEMNENKGGEISLGVEFGACLSPCKCLHIGSTPAKVVFEIDIWDLRMQNRFLTVSGQTCPPSWLRRLPSCWW